MQEASHLLIFDAIDYGLAPGTLKLVPLTPSISIWERPPSWLRKAMRPASKCSAPTWPPRCPGCGGAYGVRSWLLLVGSVAMFDLRVLGWLRPLPAQLHALASLALWIAVIACGQLLAYT